MRTDATSRSGPDRLSDARRVDSRGDGQHQRAVGRKLHARHLVPETGEPNLGGHLVSRGANAQDVVVVEAHDERGLRLRELHLQVPGGVPGAQAEHGAVRRREG